MTLGGKLGLIRRGCKPRLTRPANFAMEKSTPIFVALPPLGTGPRLGPALDSAIPLAYILARLNSYACVRVRYPAHT